MIGSYRDVLFNEMFRKSIRWRLFVFVVIATSFSIPKVIAQPEHVSPYFYPDFYKYYNPDESGMPEGMADMSKSIILLDKPFGNGAERASSTAYLIRSFLADSVCMCFTGNQLDKFKSAMGGGINFFDPATQTVIFDADIYMNYLGRDSVLPGTNKHLNLTRTNFLRKSRLVSGTLLAYERNTNLGEDIALVRLARADIPSGAYYESGYDLGVPQHQTGLSLYRVLGHPGNYPQMLGKPFLLSASTDAYIELQAGVPPSMGIGSEGSPLILDDINGRRAIGVFSYPVHNIPGLWTGHDGRPISTYIEGHFTRLGVIGNAIRSKCWNKSDSSDIATQSKYLTGKITDNNTGATAYLANRSFNSAAAIAGSPGANGLVNGTVQVTHLKGNTCNLAGFTLPAAYPGSSYPWQITVAGKEVTVGNGFSYDATGNSALHLASVLQGGTSGTPIAKLLKTDPSEKKNDLHDPENFSVYPNPSSDGIFHFDSRFGAHRIEVYAANGQQVFRDVTQPHVSKYTVNLSSLSKGVYMFCIYKLENDKKLFSRTLIYR